MKKIIGQRFSLDTILKTSSNDQILGNLSLSVEEDYGQERESRAEGCEVPIPSILETNADWESAIIVQGEGSTMNTKQEFFSPKDSALNELPHEPLCKINSVNTTKPSSSNERSLFSNCTDDAIDIIASPALNLTIDYNGTDPCRIFSNDDPSAKSNRTSFLLEQGKAQSCKENFWDDDGGATLNKTDDHRKRTLTHSDENAVSWYHDRGKFQTKAVKTDQGVKRAGIFFRCVICSATCDGNVGLERHMLIHSDEKPFRCELCSRSFRNNVYLKKHEVVHSDEKPFCCEHCNVSFKRKFDLKQHKVIHSDEKPFRCELCSRSFKTNMYLKKHEVVHSDGKPFGCENCKMSFKRRIELKQHKVIHSDEKPFGCENCKMSFKRRVELKQHKVIHSAEKPIRCELCSRSFKNNVCLKKHEVVHSDEKPFSCEHCNVSFKRKFDLKRHKVIHFDERSFRYELCNGSFNRKVAPRQNEAIHFVEHLSVASSATEHAA